LEIFQGEQAIAGFVVEGAVRDSIAA